VTVVLKPSFAAEEAPSGCAELPREVVRDWRTPEVKSGGGTRPPTPSVAKDFSKSSDRAAGISSLRDEGHEVT
jgi:hypothetical protein